MFDLWEVVGVVVEWFGVAGKAAARYVALVLAVVLTVALPVGILVA